MAITSIQGQVDITWPLRETCDGPNPSHCRGRPPVSGHHPDCSAWPFPSALCKSAAAPSSRLSSSKPASNGSCVYSCSHHVPPSLTDRSNAPSAVTPRSSIRSVGFHRPVRLRLCQDFVQNLGPVAQLHRALSPRTTQPP